MATYKIMRQDAYDAQPDAIVDKAEGIPKVTDFPVSPAEGNMILKNGKVYVRVAD